MKKKILVPVLLIMITMFFLTSCKEVEKDDSKSSTTPPSTEESQKTIEVTTTPAVPISTEKVFFEDYEIDLDMFSCNYLRQAQKAYVFDNNVSDGLLTQVEFAEVQLPEGTILVSLDSIRPGLEPYPDKMLFILADGRCVFFEQSISDSEEPLYNGKTAAELLGTSQFLYLYDYFEGTKTVVENYELLPDTPLDPSIAPQNIIINVDWDGDGKADTITRESADAQRTWEQTVWYTDGATGKRTDITDRIAGDDIDEYKGLSNNVMLFRDENTGSYALIDCFDTCSSDYSIFVYSYDEKSKIAYTVTSGVFSYDNGSMCVNYGSFIFGNLGTMRSPLIFDGKSVAADTSVEQYWWLAGLKAKENGEDIPGYFSYTLKEVPVEKKVADGYVDAVIPEGIAIFPQYYSWNNDSEKESGYLFFMLADGNEYRVSFEMNEEQWSCKFGGVPQEELFYCSWGG